MAQLSAEEWRERLKPEEYRVLREKGTEPPGSGEYDGFYPEPASGHFAVGASSLPWRPPSRRERPRFCLAQLPPRWCLAGIFARR